jgi:hypothetical protein
VAASAKYSLAPPVGASGIQGRSDILKNNRAADGLGIRCSFGLKRKQIMGNKSKQHSLLPYHDCPLRRDRLSTAIAQESGLAHGQSHERMVVNETAADGESNELNA